MSEIDDLKSLKKIKVNKLIGEISNNRNLSVKEFRVSFGKLMKRAKKEGYEDISVDFQTDNGDENNLSSSCMVLMGTRMETEEEWHKRLQHNYNNNKRILDQANRVVNVAKVYDDENDKIAEALSKSSLKCCKCGKPCSYTTWAGGKTKRICNECCEKERK